MDNLNTYHILCFYWSQNFKLFSFPIFLFWAYLMKVIERTWWRLLSVPDDGYWAYLMMVIERTWWRLLSVPDEGYWVYLMKVTPEMCCVHQIWYLHFLFILHSFPVFDWPIKRVWWHLDCQLCFRYGAQVKLEANLKKNLDV